jgi:hypothetical protein
MVVGLADEEDPRLVASGIASVAGLLGLPCALTLSHGETVAVVSREAGPTLHVGVVGLAAERADWALGTATAVILCLSRAVDPVDVVEDALERLLSRSGVPGDRVRMVVHHPSFDSKTVGRLAELARLGAGDKIFYVAPLSGRYRDALRRGGDDASSYIDEPAFANYAELWTGLRL